MQVISVAKEHSIRWRNDSHRSHKFRNLQSKARTDKEKELLSGLKQQQSICSHSMEVSDAAVKASYHIAKEIAIASKPFFDGEFIKNCLLKAIEIVCPKTPVFC